VLLLLLVDVVVVELELVGGGVLLLLLLPVLVEAEVVRLAGSVPLSNRLAEGEEITDTKPPVLKDGKAVVELEVLERRVELLQEGRSTAVVVVVDDRRLVDDIFEEGEEIAALDELRVVL